MPTATEDRTLDMLLARRIRLNLDGHIPDAIDEVLACWELCRDRTTSANADALRLVGDNLATIVLDLLERPR